MTLRITILEVSKKNGKILLEVSRELAPHEHVILLEATIYARNLHPTERLWTKKGNKDYHKSVGMALARQLASEVIKEATED